VNPRLTAPRPGAPKRRHRLPLFPEPDHVHRRPRARYPGAEDDLARLVLLAEHYGAPRAGPRAKFYSYTRLCVHTAALWTTAQQVYIRARVLAFPALWICCG
jgi:hypothetical protein